MAWKEILEITFEKPKSIENMKTVYRALKKTNTYDADVFHLFFVEYQERDAAHTRFWTSEERVKIDTVELMKVLSELWPDEHIMAEDLEGEVPSTVYYAKTGDVAELPYTRPPSPFV